MGLVVSRILDAGRDLGRELPVEVLPQEMEAQVEGRGHAARRGDEVVLHDAVLDDGRDVTQFVPGVVVGRDPPPREEPRLLEDDRARADARDGLARAEGQELPEQIPVLHDLGAARAARDDEQVQVVEVGADLVGEHLHSERPRDRFLEGPRPDAEVELGMELLRLREDLVHAHRVEFLDAVEQEDAHPHEGGR